MGDVPVFGRRGAKPPERQSPTLAQLAPADPAPEAAALAAWRQDRRRRYWRSFLGWRGAGTMLLLASLVLKLIDLNLIALLPLLGGIGCMAMSMRRREP